MKMKIVFIAGITAAAILCTSVCAETVYNSPVTIAAESNGKVNFDATKDVFKDFTVSIGDQGTIQWTNEDEAGTKDFTWNVSKPDGLEDIDGTQAYLSFTAAPSFESEATVTLVSSVAGLEDADPYLYEYTADGYTAIDYSYENVSGSDCFSFKTTKLGTYVFSDTAIALASEPTTEPTGETDVTEGTDAEKVSANEAPEQDTTTAENAEDKADSPDTGVNPAGIAVLAGLSVFSVGIIVVSSKKRK